MASNNGDQSQKAKATAPRGGHWDKLYQRAESLMTGIGRDSFLSGLLAKYLEFLPNMPGMSEADNVLHWITHFMDGTRGFAPARDAVKYLCRSHWDLATAIKRWCDVGNFSYMGEEIRSESGAGNDSGEEDEVAKLNTNVDRSPALKGQVRPDKFLIVIHQPGGKPDKRNEYQAYDHGRSFDWNQSDHIRALNRWRSQILRCVPPPSCIILGPN
ncbi:hypothetical protein N7G274_008378 [Stereocaulon virgatum]|uniref:Uncharacterized protein n=1 Tax=Stereocaulon virgatum TaxID=373712 RepID=A0ABR4A1M8_9LECA